MRTARRLGYTRAAVKYLALLIALTAFIVIATVVLIVVYYWGPRGGPPKAGG